MGAAAGTGMILLATMTLLAAEPDAQRTPDVEAEGDSGGGVSAWFVRAILAAQAIAGGFALGRDYVAPFSTAAATANFLTARGWSERLIVASTRSEATAIAGYLDRPVYNPEERRLMTYARWDIPAPSTEDTRRMLLAALDSIVTPSAPEAVVVLSYDFPRPAAAA